MRKSLRKQLLPITTFVKIDVKRLFRDKVAIFFVFVFPLIFLFVFGGIFGKNDTFSFKMALIQESNNEFTTKFVEQIKNEKSFELDNEVKNIDQAKEKMSRGEVDATVILPSGFGDVQNGKFPSGQAKILYDQSNEQSGQTLQAVFNEIFKDINNGLVKNEEPFTAVAESTASAGLTRFDYIFSGLLGFSTLSLGIFGPTTVFPRLKQKGVLRRYHSTTLKSWQYFVGNVISNAFVGILSVSVMVVASLIFFDLNMRGNYLNLYAVIILGTVMLFGIGLAIGGWAKNENQAAPLANLVTFPMMFLSGTFFPRFLMPEWLQTASGLLPLTPVVDSVRLIVTENQSLIDLAPQMGMMLGWTLVIYIVAFRVFRWE